MQNTTVEKIKKVEELQNFPFHNFTELNKAIAEGNTKASVDSTLAVLWTRNGIYSPTQLSNKITFLIALPILSMIGFIIYAITTRNWFLFLALPFFWSAPSTLLFMPWIRALVILGLAWGIISQATWLILLALIFEIIWYANRTIDRKAADGLNSVLWEHEDLLCQVWNNKGLKITLPNGNVYTLDFKIEAGKFISYEKI